jgi:hypothetical protein
MTRKTISLLLIFSLTTLFLSSTHSVFASPAGGEVDPTGLDTEDPIVVSRPQDDPVKRLSDRAAELSAMRWIRSVLLKEFRRRLSF